MWIARLLSYTRDIPNRALRPVFGIALLLVCLRCAVFVLYEQAYFDSDQAITGLMAKHLAEGRAFPLFFYGQRYMLAIEAWLAAPVFLVAGASVAALRAPLVAINAAIAVLLLRILVRDAGLRPIHALAVSAFFIVAPPVPASRLVEAQGGNVEPLLYALLLWLTRDRAIWFGLVAGIGVLNREFTAYAVGALLVVEAMEGTLLTRPNVTRKLQAAGAFIAVWACVLFVKRYADLLGPGTASAELASQSSHLSFLLSKSHWQPSGIAENVRWLFAHNLPALFGARSMPLSAFVNSSLKLSDGWLWWPLCATMAWMSARLAYAKRRATSDSSWAFGVYLLLAGLIAVFVYTFLSVNVRDEVLIRYTLLGLFIPIGLGTLYLRYEPRLSLRATVLSVLTLWSVVALWNHGRLIAEYAQRPPPSTVRQLVRHMRARALKYAWADYWTAYHVIFLADEQVIVASREKVRVAEYQTRVEAQRGSRAEIWREEGWCQSPIRVAQWYVCVHAP